MEWKLSKLKKGYEMSEHRKIGVIGSSDTVLPFRSIGAEAFEAEDSVQAIEILKEIVAQGVFGIILVEENLAESILGAISEINHQHRDVAIISIPSISCASGVALKNLSAQVIRAIGMDIFAQKGGN